MASLFVGAMREWKRSFQNVGASFMGLHARLEKVLDVSIAREVEKLESNLIVLATVASTAPFVGLFGTVWGIMTSFRSIAASKNTSLAVIAPGLAEALLATAIGLFAAIPALIFFNNLQGVVARFQARIGKLRRRVLVHPCRDRSTITSAASAIGRPEKGDRKGEPAMGMSVGAAGKKRSRRKRGVPRYGCAWPRSTMTPFIDVVLVLLIIFMVAAPLLASGVPIDLPKTTAGELKVDSKPLSVAIDDKGGVFVADQSVPMDGVIAKLQELAKDGYDERIYLRGAKDVNYGRVAEVMTLITSAGYKKVALVTEQSAN